jgi:hypothetical protein
MADDNCYDVGTNPPPKVGPPGPGGPAEIPTQPTKQNNGYVRGGVRDGKLRNSGNSGAHRIGKR